jgi:pimeloyl-ACP methyl ester carboxylesterase
MQSKVQFQPDGLTLSGILHVPDGVQERRPAIAVLHGFGGNKDGKTHAIEAAMYESWGYVVLRFDMRGCGESEGERGHILCHDQVADTKNAVTWLAGRREVHPDRIALSGQSFGAAVAVYTAGIDERVAATISMGGWGNGLQKFRGQHPTPEAWARFTQMIDEGRAYRAAHGKSLMVARWDIVPIPEYLRANLPPGSIMEFPAETAQSMCDFRAEDVIANIAPRPVLLLHAANDSVTPTEQSIEMFKHAGRGAELIVLGGIDHFPFAEENSRIRDILKGWMNANFRLVGDQGRSIDRVTRI